LRYYCAFVIIFYCDFRLQKMGCHFRQRQQKSFGRLCVNCQSSSSGQPIYMIMLSVL